MQITQLLNENCFSDRNGLKPLWVVLHGTAGGTSAEAIASYFKSTEGSNNPVSAHYVIGQDGQIVQCNKESDGAYANGVVTTGHDPWWNADGNPNPNNVTISIEHVKPDNANATALTSAQQEASFALVRDICKRNGIPARAADANGGVTGHYSIDPINRARCPGLLDWNALWTYLNGGNTMSTTTQVPNGWTDDPTNKILKAPNGVPVTLGFRDWIMNHPSWNADDWPLSPEYAANPVEQSNIPIGPGTAQEFRLGTRLGYTAKMGVYQTWAGQELQWYQKQNAAQQAQIVALKSQPNVANLLAINTLAAQIVQKSQVQ